MPQPEPIPSPHGSVKRRFWRIFRLLVLLSIVIAAIAVVLVTRGEGEVHASLIIATALGVGLTVMVGTGLMTLVFISNSSGHDEAAGGSQEENDKE
jgi:preprotein translocase subunit SecG